MIVLSSEKECFLKEIKAPVTVGIPPEDAVRDMCQMPDGEIRIYGREIMPGGEVVRCCSFSRDYGLNWQKELIFDPEVLGAMTYNPHSGEWVTTVSFRNGTYPMPSMSSLKDGSYAVVSKGGPGSSEKEFFPISENFYVVHRQPLLLRSRNRMLVTTQMYLPERKVLAPVVLYSDDSGRTWHEKILETLGVFPAAYPHKGLRWQQYSCEPTAEELDSGRLMLIARNSWGKHCIYYSEDQGETWSGPEFSEAFYTCNTMPLLKRMRDGKLLFFWCNTQPLPELDHEREQWGLSEGDIAGRAEDVFTNRDANHAAVSFDDGVTWQGFREISLNAARSFSDFRSFASGLTLDKSVHQFEALELPFGKMLLFFGQSPAARRLVIFDPEWLLEKERKEDFYKGLVNVSTQVFVNSISGSHRPCSGHCSWNRTHGALLVPDPGRDFTEVLQIVTPDDPRLFNRTQGCVWNFPAVRKGELSVRLQIAGEPLRISLTDRWFNPCDEYVDHYAQISFVLDRRQTSAGEWNDVKILFDLENSRAELLINGVKRWGLPVRCDAPAGLSYLVLQNTSQSPDFKGSLIKSMEVSGK